MRKGKGGGLSDQGGDSLISADALPYHIQAWCNYKGAVLMEDGAYAQTLHKHQVRRYDCDRAELKESLPSVRLVCPSLLSVCLLYGAISQACRHGTPCSLLSGAAALPHAALCNVVIALVSQHDCSVRAQKQPHEN